MDGENMFLDFIKRKNKKKDEKFVIYNDKSFVITLIDPNILNTSVPINFDLYILIRKPNKLIRYFSNGHQFTIKQIIKLRNKAKGKLFIIKEEEDKFERYKQLSQKVCSENYSEYIQIEKISFTETVGRSENSRIYLSKKEGESFEQMIQSFNTFCKNGESSDNIKLLLDTTRYFSYNIFKRIESSYKEKKGPANAAIAMLKETPVVRRFFLAMFFCVKNNIQDRNIIFHAVINIMDEILSKEALEAYNEYWSDLTFKEGISADAIVNITNTVAFCRQFENIIEHLSPPMENKISIDQ